MPLSRLGLETGVDLASTDVGFTARHRHTAKAAGEYENRRGAGNHPVREPVRAWPKMRLAGLASQQAGIVRSGVSAAAPAVSVRIASQRLAPPRPGLPPEFGGVGPWRQTDSDRMIRTILSQVMLSELLSYFIGRHTNDGVLTGIEVLRKLEEFYADRAFFESAGRTVNRVLDDVLEELPASLARAKRRALQQTIEFRPYGLLA